MNNGTENEQVLGEPQVSPESSGTSAANTSAHQVVASFEREHPEWVARVVLANNEVTVVVPREHIDAACAYLKTSETAKFDFLADISGVDRGTEEEPRFEVNYHLFSTQKFHRIRLKVLLNDNDVHVPTVTGIWRTANWHERETFDLFGVIFDGHPDLRRILLPEDWQGHALRKDFPLRGYEPYSLK